MNFSMLLQRATPFKSFEDLLAPIGLKDPMVTLLGLGLLEELWVEGEPAGYVHRLAKQIAKGKKKVLLTEAWLDKQVSNQATEIMARSLGLPVLEGSIAQSFQQMEDTEGPVDSAMAIYDLGFFDISPDGPHTGVDGQGDSLIPPLANQIGSGVCDPHPRRLTLRASLDQFVQFMQPGGQIENFCTGLCDGATEDEQARNLSTGEVEECDPLPSED